MNSECDIVMDLAGIYFDKTAADATNDYIKGHVKRCENCRKFYRQFSKFKKKQNKTSFSDVPKWEGNYAEIASRLSKRRMIFNILAVSYGVSMLGIIAWIIKRDR